MLVITHVSDIAMVGFYRLLQVAERERRSTMHTCHVRENVVESESPVVWTLVNNVIRLRP